MHAESAVRILEKLPEKSIGVPWASTRATIALSGARRFEKAQFYAEKAVEQFTEFSVDTAVANGLSYHALALAGNGQFDLALEKYQASATLREEAGLVTMAILTYGDAGDLADSQGNTAVARQMFTRAVGFDVPSTQPNACYAQMRLNELSNGDQPPSSFKAYDERFKFAQKLIDASDGKIEAERIRLTRARNHLLQPNTDLALIEKLGDEILDLTSTTVDRFGLRSGGFSVLARGAVQRGSLVDAERLLAEIPQMPTYTLFHQFLAMLPAEREMVEAYQAKGDSVELERLLRWAVEVRETNLPANDFQLALARARLARFLRRTGRSAESASVAQSALDAITTNSLVDEKHRASIAQLATDEPEPE